MTCLVVDLSNNSAQHEFTCLEKNTRLCGDRNIPITEPLIFDQLTAGRPVLGGIGTDRLGNKLVVIRFFKQLLDVRGGLGLLEKTTEGVVSELA